MSDKNIWIYWNSGVENAPKITKICVESWFYYNKDWNIVLLNDENISSYVNMQDTQNKNIGIQLFSDILRIRLLNKYGGVWCDATTYCNSPLDSWIHQYSYHNDVFFFKPKGSTVFCSWFIYSKKENKLIKKLCEEEDRYVYFGKSLSYYMNIKFFWRLLIIIEKNIGNGNYFLWRNYFFRSSIGLSPYFLPNYLLGYLIYKDKEVKEIYEKIKPYDVSLNQLHIFQSEGLASHLQEKIINDFYKKKTPIYKMSYKRDMSLWERNGVFKLLAEEIEYEF